MRGDTEPVEKALSRVAYQSELELLTAFMRLPEQAVVDGRSDVDDRLRHDAIASR
jgi:hypothetical protein